LGDWFGRFMTLYRSVGDGLIPDPPRSRIEIEWDLQQGAVLERHPWTRVAWRRCADATQDAKPARAKASKKHAKVPKTAQAVLYLAGQTHHLPIDDARLIAASATLDDERYAALSNEAQGLVHAWIAQGHYRLNLGDDHDEAI
jgi:50S ribosomal protein L16 3-hydroxylase